MHTCFLVGLSLVVRGGSASFKYAQIYRQMHIFILARMSPVAAADSFLKSQHEARRPRIKCGSGGSWPWNYFKLQSSTPGFHSVERPFRCHQAAIATSFGKNARRFFSPHDELVLLPSPFLCRCDQV